MRNKFTQFLVFLSYLAAFAVGPYTHLLHGHDEAASAAGKPSLVEYCGGEEHPCSRKDHHHASHDAAHHICPICKVTGTANSLLAVAHLSVDAPTLLGWVFSKKQFAQLRFESSIHPSRAPPIL